MHHFVRKYVTGARYSSEYAPYIFYVLVVYMAVSTVYTAIYFAWDEVLVHALFVAVIMAGFIVLERSPVSNGLRAFLVPLILAGCITANAFYFDGDSLIFTYTIGCALIALTYMHAKGLARFTVCIGAVQLALILLTGRNLMGDSFTPAQTMMGLLASVTINSVICIFCKHYSNAMVEISKARDAADKAAIVKGAFLSNMSHEIRTPLNAIIGMTAIGRQSSELEAATYALTRVENASQHLLGVVNDILDTAKIDSGKLELATDPFDFHEVIDRVVNIISQTASMEQQTLRVDIGEDIPRFLVGDDLRLAQILMNILSNAVKFTPAQGDIHLEATLLEERGGVCTLRFCITDNGIGISDEQQKNLFHAFYQAESNSVRKYGGTGLGLSITKNIIEMMDGSIALQSELGKGTAVTITLQMQRSDAETTPQDPNNHADLHAHDFSAVRILLVEDIEINREIATAMLAPHHIQITCAENGQQAVARFTQTPDAYDIIFMDVQMPVMDGYTSTQTIRALPHPRAAAIPIVAMTANVMEEDVKRCLASGMNDHISKPIDANAMLAVIVKHVNK